MKLLKVCLTLITTLGLLFGTVGVTYAKTTTHLSKSTTHITHHAKTNRSAIKKSSYTKSVPKATTLKPTAKKISAKTSHHA